MPEEKHSAVVTLLLIAALNGVWLFISLRPPGALAFVLVWPWGFAWCVLIAARIWRGHKWP